MSYAGFCEKCGVPYYESDRLAHEHKTAEPAVVSAEPSLKAEIDIFAEKAMNFQRAHYREKLNEMRAEMAKIERMYPELAAAQPVAADLPKPSPEYDVLLTEAVKRKGQPPDIQRLAEDSYRAGEAEYRADLSKVEELKEFLLSIPHDIYQRSVGSESQHYSSCKGCKAAKLAAILRPYFQGSQTPTRQTEDEYWKRVAANVPTEEK